MSRGPGFTLFGGQGASRIQLDQLRFEQARTETLLRGLGMSKLKNLLISDYQRVHGKRELRMASFCERFPTFPFVLSCGTLRDLTCPWGKTEGDYHVHRDPHSTVPEKFKQFSAVPYVVAYVQLYDSVPAAVKLGRRVGLIFPRKGFRDGMVIHDDDSEQFWEHGLCEVYKFPKTGRRLYVHPFSTLVAAIHNNGRGWRPPER